MRFGAFIITYNRPQGLQKVIAGMLAQSQPPEQIVVVDNGNSSHSQNVIERFDPKIVIHRPMGDNLGPAGAALHGIRWLTEQGFDWVAWGDDNDPPPVTNAFERLLTAAQTLNDSNVAAVGAVGARWNWQTGEFARLPDQTLYGLLDVDTLGGGHQFIQSTAVVRESGLLPDPQLFFGFFDPEYCLRLKKAGYRLVVDGDLMRQYREQAGRLNTKQQRSYIPRYPYHTIWQQYYRTRNYIYMMSNTFDRSDLARRETIKALGRVVGSWSRGPQYGLKFTKLQIRGILDGHRGRLGRTVTPTVQEGKVQLLDT